VLHVCFPSNKINRGLGQLDRNFGLNDTLHTVTLNNASD